MVSGSDRSDGLHERRRVRFRRKAYFLRNPEHSFRVVDGVADAMFEHDGVGWRDHVDIAYEVDSDRLQTTDLSGQSGIGIEKGASDGCGKLRPDSYFVEVGLSHHHHFIGTDEQLTR